MKVWLASDFAARDFPQPVWAIPQLVPGYGLSLVYAYGKIGKSILSIQLAQALTNQTPFLNIPPERKWRVLYIQSDEKEAEWAYQLKQVGLVDNWHTIWTPIGLMNDLRRVKELQEIAKDFEYIIYDALITISGYSLNLDEPSAVGRCLQVIEEISPLPGWVVHHKRKGIPGVPDHISVSAAGSFSLVAGVSAIFDLTDTELKTRGRLSRASINLKRNVTGLWIPKTKDDVYKL